jgi:hypothetical protein
LLTINPDIIPPILLSMDDKAIYHNMMNKPNKPCQTSDSYSFTACISMKIGCRMQWDVWSSRDIPLCTTVEQILQFENEYDVLWDSKEDVLWDSKEDILLNDT